MLSAGMLLRWSEVRSAAAKCRGGMGDWTERNEVVREVGLVSRRRESEKNEFSLKFYDVERPNVTY
jgi:hypothetical protein